MNILSAFLVAVGLSMDNFAVTIASGCCYRQAIPKTYVAKVSFLFSLSHWVMFSAGWFLGREAGKYIGAVDHWIAFALLCFIGGRMIRESRKEAESSCFFHSFKTLCVLAIATSLDALVVGMGLSFAGAPFFVTAAALIGSVFITSWIGFYVGAFLGKKFGRMMEALGGVILVLIGFKFLLEGMGIC